jgi:hypothetical protein
MAALMPLRGGIRSSRMWRRSSPQLCSPVADFPHLRFVVPRFEATYAERTAAIKAVWRRRKTKAAEAALRQYNEQLAEARTEAARIRESQE